MSSQSTVPSTEDWSVVLSRRFILISLVYFLVGAFWMGFGFFLPEPYTPGTFSTSFVMDAFNTARVHVMVLGWASFSIIGVLYYAVPKIANRPLHSKRLGRIHFWITNITIPIGILLVIYLTWLMGSMLQAGSTMDQVFTSSQVLVGILVVEAFVAVGFIAQALFAYNVYKTMKG